MSAGRPSRDRGQWTPRSRPASKGHRLDDWARVTILDKGEGRHSLLVRRGSDGRLAYYLC